MIGHFPREAALIIEKQGGVMGGARHLADQRALMEVRVDNVRLQAAHLSQDDREERGVEIEFVPRRADNDPLAPRNINTALNRDAGDIMTVVIGANRHPMPEALEYADLLKGTDMRAVIGKKRCRCDHKHRK